MSRIKNCNGRNKKQKEDRHSQEKDTVSWKTVFWETQNKTHSVERLNNDAVRRKTLSEETHSQKKTRKTQPVERHHLWRKNKGTTILKTHSNKVKVRIKRWGPRIRKGTLSRERHYFKKDIYHKKDTFRKTQLDDRHS